MTGKSWSWGNVCAPVKEHTAGVLLVEPNFEPSDEW